MLLLPYEEYDDVEVEDDAGSSKGKETRRSDPTPTGSSSTDSDSDLFFGFEGMGWMSEAVRHEAKEEREWLGGGGSGSSKSVGKTMTSLLPTSFSSIFGRSSISGSSGSSGGGDNSNTSATTTTTRTTPSSITVPVAAPPAEA